MARNYNPRDQISYNTNNSGDISMSIWEYHDFIDCLLDDRLSAEGLMKFKRLHQVNSMALLVVPTLTFPIAYFAQKWLQGNVNRGMASARMNFMGMALVWPIFMYVGYTSPVPRKLYTDVLADSGPDGSYIRQSVRTRKPGLWSKLSSQLHNKRFNYPQMHEYKRGIEFPTDFVNSKVY